MGMYKEGLNRNQQLLLPPSLDDLVGEDNMVRAIEEYVNILDISSLNIKTKKGLTKIDADVNSYMSVLEALGDHCITIASLSFLNFTNI